ncbi:MAG: TIGR03905 family TSCPD domain-containing protein [Bacteroidales bacterium]|nr:TIGR03905 family TSCPD domain-containing protein [Bacteroidales bacterium]
MKHHYTTAGTCSAAIDFDIDENGIIRNIKFHGGCPGNTVGICKLAEGMPAKNVADNLRGTDCRSRGTSCPDQLAKAIDLALAEA